MAILDDFSLVGSNSEAVDELGYIDLALAVLLD